jgi:predicted Zn-dependent protease with MMP-like domain
MQIKKVEFDRYVRQAIESLEPEFRQYLAEMPVIVDDEPDEATCRHFGQGAKRELLGQFRGVPLNRRSVEGQNGPNQIVLYRLNLLNCCDSQEELVEEIRKTLVHELGHFIGFSEEGLEEYDY